MMSDQQDWGARDEESTEVPEADALEQQRDALEEPADPEQTVTAAAPDGIRADPADVVDQNTDVPVADDEREVP